MFKYLWLIILLAIEGITGYHAVIDIIDSIRHRHSLDDRTDAWLILNGALLFVASLVVFITQGGETP